MSKTSNFKASIHTSQFKVCKFTYLTTLPSQHNLDSKCNQSEWGQNASIIQSYISPSTINIDYIDYTLKPKLDKGVCF